MTDKELQRLKRGELLEMLLEQSKENDRLKEEVEELRAQLADRKIEIESAGTIAEASFKLNGVFDAAQAAAQQYLDNLQLLYDREEVNCVKKEEETEAYVKKLLEDENIEPVWILSGQGENLSSELVTKQADEPVDILITLGNAETETAVDYLQADTSYKRQFMIYGEGCSDKTVYYLDKGIIKSLVVPNEFNMGYQSVHTIAEQIKYKFSSAESTTVESFVINRQNLYDEENQKILFPIVQ